tara:strand:- start:3293 stop:3823 length:531 start_codon:yes stop_codon:yes gene_type:complete
MAAGKFWNSPEIEPKRQHRWALEITALGRSLVVYLTKTDKPSLEINETEHKYFGHSFFYPGHLTWQPITCTFVDPFGDQGTTGQLKRWLARSGYAPPESGPQPQSISKRNALGRGGNVVLTQYNTDDAGKPKPGEKWKLYNAWFQKINYGSLDYSSDAMVNVDVTIRYDYAVNTRA